MEEAMFCVSSQDLQKQVGEVQTQAALEPVLITARGKPRCVLLSVNEYARLKAAAGEPVPDGVRRRGVTYRAKADPLGYDLRDINAAMLAMADDALSGRGQEEVERELAEVRKSLGRNER
jgi:prevent-host-death family protein